MLDPKMGMTELPEKCRKCGSPLVVKDDWTGCWQCLTNKETAKRGRELLAKLKERLKEPPCTE